MTKLVPPPPRRVAVRTLCPSCRGDRCAECGGTGLSPALHYAFERAELEAAFERMKLDTSVRRSG